MTALIVIGSILAYFGVGVFAARFGANNVYKYGKNWSIKSFREDSIRTVGMLMFFLWPIIAPMHLIWVLSKVSIGKGNRLRGFLLPAEAEEIARQERAVALRASAEEMRRAGEQYLADTLLAAARDLEARR